MTQTRSKSGKSSAQRQLANQHRAAIQARVARQRRRARLTRVGIPVAVLVVALTSLVAVRLLSGSTPTKSGQLTTGAANSVVTAVTNVPAAVLDTIGTGTSAPAPTAINAPALVDGGKPEVLYVGAEYCPFCAAERWPLVVALSRFGTFANLSETASSPSDVYPNTATLSFHGATYSSQYLTFVGKETHSNQVVGSGYAPLDSLTPAESAVLNSYDPGGGVPFLDLGGRYTVSGATYATALLQGRTHEQIATALSDPSSPIARGADGAANVITAALCVLTGGQPTAVCTSKGATDGATVLPHAS